MTSECGKYEQHIPRSFVGDLTPEEQQALDLHLAACHGCKSEQARYAETVRILQSADDEPVPRHFFVYPDERIASPWQLFRLMMPRWQAATAGVAALILLLAVLSVTGLQVRADQGGWAMSFGHGNAPSTIDVAALKADILRTADERNREIAIAWIQDLRSEIAGARTDLTQRQQVQLAEVLTSLESRLDNRIALAAEDARAGTQKSFADLYQAVSLRHEQDLNTVNTRLDSVVENNEIKARQTDAILETLLQLANLNLKQIGDQK